MRFYVNVLDKYLSASHLGNELIFVHLVSSLYRLDIVPIYKLLGKDKTHKQVFEHLRSAGKLR